MVKSVKTAATPPVSRSVIENCHTGPAAVLVAATEIGADGTMDETPLVGAATVTLVVAPPLLNAASPPYCALTRKVLADPRR